MESHVGIYGEPWKPFLTNNKARDILNESQIKNWKLVTVTDEDTPNYVLHLLAEKHISSVPVISTKQVEPERSGVFDSEHYVIGCIDTLDVMNFALWTAQLGIRKPSAESEELVVKEFEKPIKETNLMNCSRRNWFCILPREASLARAVHFLSYPFVHRVGIGERDQKDFAGVITQSELVGFLLKHESRGFDKLLRKTVGELWGTEPQRVHSIHQDRHVLDALKLIDQVKVTGIAVVDDTGALVGSISASDVKHAGLAQYERRIEQLIEDFNVPISHYLGIEKGGGPAPSTITAGAGVGVAVTSYARAKHTEVKLTPAVVSSNDTLRRVMELLSDKRNSSIGSTHIHRVFVVDSQRKPVREISPCDVISIFRV